jgi:hypothetical protein
MVDPGRNKQLNTCLKLDEATANKYCWAYLAMMAMETDGERRISHKESARNTDTCFEDMFRTGSCYCGKMVHIKEAE